MQITAIRRVAAAMQQASMDKVSWSVPNCNVKMSRSALRKLAQPEFKPTPLMALGSGFHAKLEGMQEGGSVKDRAVTKCVYGMLQNGLLQPGGTLALCTSGSAGVSLLRAQRLLQDQGVHINVKIFMPESYVAKAVPQKIVGTEGVVIERDNVDDDNSRCLCPFDGDFVSSLAHMKQLAQLNDWAILDQHYDVNSMMAHESTAVELMQQCPDVTDVVCTTGTGGTAAGLREFLPAHVTVHARPAVSGTLDGCTDVRRYNNFCDPSLLEGYTTEFFCPEEARAHAAELQERFQIASGPSSGASFALAKKVKAAKPDAVIAFICADGQHQPAAWQAGMKGCVARSGFVE
jgi:cysteine synthase